MKKTKELRQTKEITQKNKNQKNTGITLIALVITIIIILILAGVAIASLTGENGLLNRAVGAKISTEEAQEKEQLQMEVYGSYGKNGDLDIRIVDSNIKSHINGVTTDGATTFPLTVTMPTGNVYTIDEDGNVTKEGAEVAGGGTGTGEIPTVTVAPKTAVEKTTKYDDGTNKADGTSVAIIPKGFKVINEGDNPKIEDGLVVKDGANNEWVWIPVADASVMYTKDETGIPITGGSGKTYVSGVTTNYYSKGGIISGKTRGLPNTTSWREPDVVVESDGAQYDAVEANYIAAGFSSLQNMAQSLVDDYEEMIKSVEKNKGFYVGRYELTGTVASPTEVSGEPLAYQNWYNLYKACKGFTVEGVVESRMMWGCQWDVMCNYVADSKHSITDSSTWGNYKTTDVKSSDGSTIIKANGTSQRLETGVTTFTMAKNIYDIAGNCFESTQEAYYTFRRAYRGGIYSLGGSGYPASYCDIDIPTFSSDYYSSRPQLYIK